MIKWRSVESGENSISAALRLERLLLVRSSLLAYGKYAARPRSSQINESEASARFHAPLTPVLLLIFLRWIPGNLAFIKVSVHIDV